MSTKIYNGYIIPHLKGCSAEELFTFARAKAEKYRSIIQSMFYEQLVRQAVFNIDTSIVFKGECNKDNFSDLSEKFNDMFVKNAGFTFFVDEKDKNVYLMTFFGNNEVAQIFERSEPLIREYMYWDNTDCPDDITQEEFDKRGETWDRLCPHSASEGGFNISLFSYYPFVNDQYYEYMWDTQPSLAERLDKIAEDTLMGEFFKQKEASGEYIRDYNNMSSWFDIYEQFRTLERDPIRVEAIKAEAKKIIPEKYTLDIYRKLVNSE